MKLGMIFLLSLILNFSSYASEKSKLNEFDKKLIQEVFNSKSKSELMNRYFSAIQQFSVNYYGINPLITNKVAGQYLLLVKTDDSAKIFNLIHNIDSYIDFELIGKHKDLYKVHLASFLSELLTANLYSFNITEIEFEENKVEIDENLLKTLSFKITTEGRSELLNLYHTLNLEQNILESRLENCSNNYACGIAIYDDLARAAIVIQDNEVYQEIFNSYERFNSEELKMNGPLGEGSTLQSNLETSRQNRGQDYLREAAILGNHAPLARLRGEMHSTFDENFIQQDPMLQDHSRDRMSGFIRDMSTAYGGGDYGPSFGDQRKFDRGVVTKEMVKVGVDLIGRVETGAVAASVSGQMFKGSTGAIVTGFAFGFFKEEIVNHLVDKVGTVVEKVSKESVAHVTSSEVKLSNSKKETKTETVKEPKTEPKKEPKKEQKNEPKADDEEEIKKKKGSSVRIDPRVLENLNKDVYIIGKLAKQKMIIKMNINTNPGKPSVYARCVDSEGDFLEANTGSRNLEAIRGMNTINNRIYESKDMPLIHFDEDKR